MDNKGRGSELLLLSLLIVALLVAWLVVQNMSSMHSGKSQDSQQKHYVDQAQDVVDALNQKLDKNIEEEK